MSQSDEILQIRIAERLHALGLSERKASMMATGKPDTLRFIRTRGVTPSAARLFKIAHVLKADPLYLLGGTEKNDWSEIEKVVEVGSTFSDQAIEDRSNSDRTIPIFETKSVSYDMQLSDGTTTQLTLTGLGKEIVGFAARPNGSDDARLIAFYTEDVAMYPIVSRDVPVIVDLLSKPQMGDLAMIYLKTTEERDPSAFTILRLVDISKAELTVEQFTPRSRYKWPADTVHAMHRVISMRDYVLPSPRHVAES